jgi:hypothetical protein
MESEWVFTTLAKASSYINRGVEQVQTLAKLRDTLLPRLISGQLRIN